MNNTIGDGALKIACIQTLPGYEFKVQHELELACDSLPDISDSIFLKGFGSFDIVSIYLTNEYGSHLRKAGPINGIVKSNILLCYPYTGIDASSILQSLKKNTYTSFCLLKISPGLKDSYPQIDQLLRSYFSDKSNRSEKTNWHLLGSLGWNEIIVLCTGNDLLEVLKDTFNFGKILLKTQDGDVSVILKSLSFLCINYDCIPTDEELKKGITYTKYYFQKIPSINNVILNSRDTDLAPSITTTLKPLCINNAKDFFKKNNFDIIDVAGKTDVIFSPKDKISLGDFLAVLLIFRYSFSQHLFETNTNLGLKNASFKIIDSKEISAPLEPFNFENTTLEQIFDKELASTFSNSFFTLNSFFQNPYYGPAFKAMHKYPQYILELGKELKKRGKHLHFAQGAREVLKLGAELRTYGTFDTLESVVGKFSEFRGGAQLSLQALEYFPLFVLDRLRIKWMGYVVTGDPKFYHINEVINVPSETMWKPEQWWAMFHEIAHVIIDNEPSILSRDLPEVCQFLSNKSTNDDYSWISTLTEFTAEVIGFELFFFGDFDKFMEVLWKHLVYIERFQDQHVSLDSYALRTFFVQLFIGHFRKVKSEKRVSKKQFSEDLDYLYTEIIKHMDYIEKITKKPIFKDKEFTAANNAKIFIEIYNFACHLNKVMKNYQIKPDKKSLRLKNTDSVVTKLINGQLWPGNIVCPEAVLYRLTCSSNINFKTRIATILTFWNQQMIRTGGSGK